MSTLTQWRSAAACSTFLPATSSGVLRRLIAARKEQTRRRVYSCFARQSDNCLVQFGFTAEDIRALRASELRLPNR